MQEYYKNVKEILIDTEVKVGVKEYYANKIKLEGYYKVGKELSEAGKHYGENIIKKYSEKLQKEIGKKYSVSTLKYMRQFYWLIEKSQPLVGKLSNKLSWSHWIQLLPLKNIDEINYYIKICEEQNITKRELIERIKSKEYERLPDSTKHKLKDNKELDIIETIKEPIVIKTNNKIDIEEVSEKVLKELILNDIDSFMNELGTGYMYVGNEYKIKIGNNYNYIDILLYNIDFNCYVVIELKITELKKEHIGQIQTYMEYIDINLKKHLQSKTIGIVIVRKNNKFIIEYCSNPNIISREYQIEI